MELAVAVIMATYFGQVIKSLVADIIMPPIGLAIGGVDFAALKMVLKEGQPAVMNGEEVVTSELAEVAINYGNFINIVITFVIVALVVFLLVRSYNKYLKKKKEDTSSPPPNPTEEVQLLKEIRDSLRK